MVTKLDEYKDKYIIEGTQLLGFDESSLKLFNEKSKTKINYDSFKNNNEIIIYNKAQGTGKDNKVFYDSFTKYKVGDEITLPVLTKNYLGKPDVQQLKKIMDKGETLTFKVVGVVDYEVITNSIPFNGYGLIMSTESFERLTGVDSPSAVALNFESAEYGNKHFEKLNIIADENKVSYVDISKQKEQYDEVVKQMIILVYGFIGLIILISTVNIINTVTINLLVKKREYATFKAIGMTKGQFKKLVLLEGALFGIIACIIGLPISYLLTYFGIVQNNPMGAIGYTAAIWPYIAGGVGMISITLLAAMFPLRKLNDMNIVEALRIEE
jgi:putative ABC transport system permease protein